MQYMMRRFAVALCVLAVGLPVSSWASRSLSPGTQRLTLVQRDFTRQYPAGAVGLDVDRTVYRQMLKKGRVVLQDFPLPGLLPVDLELESFDVLAADARILVVDSSGEHEAPRPTFRAFRGVVAGDPDSLVTLSLFENRIAGSIRLWDEEFVIGPREFNLARESSGEITVRNKSMDMDRPNTPMCDAEPDTAESMLSVPRSRGDGRGAVTTISAIDGETLLQADVAIDATYDWYTHFGSLAAAQNYILNLMAQVSTIYQSEVKIQLEVPYLRIFATPGNPYTPGATDTSLLLSELRSEWNTNQTGVQRTVAHLFSVRPSGGSGLAYINVLCHNSFNPGSSADYGVSTLSANGGAWEKGLVAHELGHNFSSPHTHCYAPEIDQCATAPGCYNGTTVQTVGTIMSYCNQTDKVFHPRVEDERIRPAAEEAFPLCISTAGLPGSLEGSGAVVLQKPTQCPVASLENDDGSVNSFSGYLSTARMAWIKRFTPTCYPFRLDRVDVQIGHASSVAAGRPIRVLVYTEPSGSGDPGDATLATSEDTTVQVVSNVAFNQYTLADPVTLSSGDFYLGFFDLLADAPNTYLGNVDWSTAGDSFRTADSTSPEAFSQYSGGTWFIRGSGGAVGSDSLTVQWGTPCNDATTPGQDFAVYQGAIGDFADYDSLTCTTDHDTSYVIANTPANSFYLVVPSTSANEGSYGRNSAGTERPAATLACKPQSIGACP